jgi:hypothetical protein
MTQEKHAVVIGDTAYIPMKEAAVLLNTPGLSNQTNAVMKEEGSSQWAPWGPNDDHPQKVIEDVKKSTIIGPKLDLLARFLYSGNVQYGKVEIDEKGNDKFKRAWNKEINSWLRKSGFNRYLIEASKDLVWFYHIFPEIILDENKKVLGIATQAAENCRFSWANKRTGRSETVLVNKNRALGSPSEADTKSIPALDPYYGAIEQIKAEKRGKNFIYPISYPVPGCEYYQIPEWNSVRTSGWASFANRIPEYKNKLMDNQLSIKYIIRVADWYWEWKYPGFTKMSQKDRDKKVAETLDEITTKLSGTGATGKAIMVTDKSMEGRTEVMKGVVIEAVDDQKMKDGKYVEDGKMANEHIIYALNLDHQLAGSPPGGGLGAGSGSDIRVALNKHMAFIKPFQDLLLEPLYLISELNGWTDAEEWRFANPMVTKLDEGKEVTQQAK